jgi:membrane protease YdiL (CAAX protease family)
MKKEIKNMKFKKFFTISYAIFFLFFVLFWILALSLKLNLDLESIYYWLLLVGLVILRLFYKIKSDSFLNFGLVLFAIGVIFFLFFLKNQSEFIFRNSFLFLFFGTILSLLEYRNERQQERK